MEPVPKAESPAAYPIEREVPTPTPLPAVPGVYVTNLTMASPTEMIPATNPVPDLLAATWDKVKDGPKGDNSNLERGLDVLGADEVFRWPTAILTFVFPGDDITKAQSEAAPFTPFITTTASAVGRTDIGKAVKEGIDHFFDGMPILMHALDEVKALHPFIGGTSTLR
jgi:hypothetical protein